MALLKQYIDAGLIQFGLFGNQPFRLNLHMLPSYPNLLDITANAIADRIDTKRIDHLLCPLDTTALTALVSNKTRLPMVYSQGRIGSPVFDLVGAYDTGHPTAMICNTNSSYQDLHTKGGKVGLNVFQTLVVIDVAGHDQHDSLFTMVEVVDTCDLPEGQAEAIKRWLALRV